MNKVLCCVFIGSILSFACSKEQVNPAENPATNANPKAPSARTYLIKKGNHYCEDNQVQFITAHSISASVTFDSSAIYTSVIAENQGDVNKLIGFSDCGTDHQQNSARLGWSWNGKNVIIYAYAYVNGLRVIKTLGPVEINQSFSCYVNSEKGKYYFKAGTYTDSIPAHCSAYSGMRYKLFPYFGGDEPASHDISVTIRDEEDK